MSQETTNRSFDELASGLASGSISRGKALRLMGAALVGGTLASLGIGGVAAADLCKPSGKACKKNSQCCSGNCDGGTCSACPLGRVRLDNGTCAKQCYFASSGECTGAGCACDYDYSGAAYCATAGGSGQPCEYDSECPPGDFCELTGTCVAAC